MEGVLCVCSQSSSFLCKVLGFERDIQVES
jgi:hypothetical protein